MSYKKAKEIYEKETGKVSPSNQIAYDEWYIEYVKWLQEKVISAEEQTHQNNNERNHNNISKESN